jgi:hypothetical protein
LLQFPLSLTLPLCYNYYNYYIYIVINSTKKVIIFVISCHPIFKKSKRRTWKLKFPSGIISLQPNDLSLHFLYYMSAGDEFPVFFYLNTLFFALNVERYLLWFWTSSLTGFLCVSCFVLFWIRTSDVVPVSLCSQFFWWGVNFLICHVSLFSSCF